MTAALTGLGQLGAAQATTTAPRAAARVSATVPRGSVTSGAGTTGAVGAGSTAGAVRVATLRREGSRVDVVVRGLRTSAQRRWVERVVDDAFVQLDGCLSAGGAGTVRAGVYRRHVYLLCSGGPARVRAAAAALRTSHSWYVVGTRSVAVTAFEASVERTVGNGDAVPAALAQLPHREFTWVDGDDVAFAYVGTGVTQRSLDAALRAFARAQQVSLRRVHVSRLTF